MSDGKKPRLETIVMSIYDERIKNYARGYDSVHSYAVDNCIPAIVSATLPEHYAAVVLTSRMDNELRKLLARAVHRQGDDAELLFKYNCPFGTFSAKINAGYSFGFLTKKMYDTLNCCRKIRNVYVHADNPDDAAASKDYIKFRDKLLSLDTEYTSDCSSRFLDLREKCKEAIAELPQFSIVISLMLHVCEGLQMTAFYAHSVQSNTPRFPCAYFGTRDNPALNLISMNT